MPKGIYKRKKPSLRKGIKLSEQHKRKLSEVRIKRKRRLGYLNSFETRRKISEALKGKKATKETLLKKSGKIPWNKGLTKETDNRVRLYSKKNKGKPKSEIHKKKLSIANQGLKQTPERKKKISEGLKGEKNHQWLGGKSFEPYDKIFNMQFKKLIRKRDNDVCMLCDTNREKIKRELDVHHVDYDKLNSCKENCISLCKSCHSKSNKNRNEWIIFFQSLLNKKYGY